MDLISSDYDFIITSLSFNDLHKGKVGTYTFNITLQIDKIASYLSLDSDNVRLDVAIVMISTVESKTMGFTLNANGQIVINSEKDNVKEEIKLLINNKNQENEKKIDAIIRPIIIKEIENFLQKTFYKSLNLDVLFQNK